MLTLIRRIPLASGFALAAVFAVAAAVLPAQAGPNDAHLIQKMAESGSPAEQEQICRGILADPKAAAYAHYFCQGYTDILEGHDALAEDALLTALADRKEFATGPLLYGDLYARLGKLDLAEKYYRSAIAIQPNRTDTRFALGSLLVRRGRQDAKVLPQALEAFREMTQADPSVPEGWSNMGLVLALMGRTDDAAEMYRRAIARSPAEDPFLYDGLASVYARGNRTEEAERNWLQALSISPGYGPAVIELSAPYARTGRLARAIEVLENGRAAAQAPPWGPRIRRNLGFAYLRLGDMNSARDRFVQAAAGGEDALSWLGLAHVYMLTGDREGALTAFERGAEIDSTLSLPFVRAWKGTLQTAVKPEAQPALARVLRSAGAAAAENGEAATNTLVSYVLEGWSFDDAEGARADIRASVADTTRSGYDTPPIPIEKVDPVYPDDAEEAGTEGTVQVTVTVSEAGHVIDARIERCNAPDAMCESALAAARKWTFRPATRYGSPVRASLVLPFRFMRRGE